MFQGKFVILVRLIDRHYFNSSANNKAFNASKKETEVLPQRFLSKYQKKKGGGVSSLGWHIHNRQRLQYPP